MRRLEESTEPTGACGEPTSAGGLTGLLLVDANVARPRELGARWRCLLGGPCRGRRRAYVGGLGR